MSCWTSSRWSISFSSMVPSMVMMLLPARGQLLFGVFDDVDAEVVEADVDLVELFRKRGDLLRKDLVDLVVKEEPFFFA